MPVYNTSYAAIRADHDDLVGNPMTRAELKRHARTLCRNRILERYTLERQNTLNGAVASRLASDSERAEQARMTTWIKACREACHDHEGEISASELPATYDLDEGWPDFDSLHVPAPRTTTVSEAFLAEVEAQAEKLGKYEEREATPDGEGPPEAFILEEQLHGETTEQTRERLLLEFETLMNKTRLVPPAPLSEAERERYRALTSGLGK